MNPSLGKANTVTYIGKAQAPISKAVKVLPSSLNLEEPSLINLSRISKELLKSSRVFRAAWISKLSKLFSQLSDQSIKPYWREAEDKTNKEGIFTYRVLSSLIQNIRKISDTKGSDRETLIRQLIEEVYSSNQDLATPFSEIVGIRSESDSFNSKLSAKLESANKKFQLLIKRGAPPASKRNFIRELLKFSPSEATIVGVRNDRSPEDARKSLLNWGPYFIALVLKEASAISSQVKNELTEERIQYEEIRNQNIAIDNAHREKLKKIREKNLAKALKSILQQEPFKSSMDRITIKNKLDNLQSGAIKFFFYELLPRNHDLKSSFNLAATMLVQKDSLYDGKAKLQSFQKDFSGEVESVTKSPEKQAKLLFGAIADTVERFHSMLKGKPDETKLLRDCITDFQAVLKLREEYLSSHFKLRYRFQVILQKN